MANLDKKRYYKKASKKPVSHEHLQLTGTGVAKQGMQLVWGAQNTKQKSATPDNRSMAAKWRDVAKTVPKNNRNITTDVQP